MLVIFHRYGVSHWDGFLHTDFYAEGRKRGWHVVGMLGAAQVNFASPESQQNTRVVLDWMLANYNVDRARIYGVGFSMGGGSATSYAARHLDPAGSMFAALVDHTGSVSLQDTYDHERGPNWPFPQCALDVWFGDGTQGSAERWKPARSSVVHRDPSTPAGDPDHLPDPAYAVGAEVEVHGEVHRGGDRGHDETGGDVLAGE